MSEVTLYMVTAIVIHVLVGNDVASPSLNSVSPLFKKISYGIAIPTVGGPSKGVLLRRPADRISQIVIAGAVNAHVAVNQSTCGCFIAGMPCTHVPLVQYLYGPLYA